MTHFVFITSTYHAIEHKLFSMKIKQGESFQPKFCLLPKFSKNNISTIRYSIFYMEQNMVSKCMIDTPSFIQHKV